MKINSPEQLDVEGGQFTANLLHFARLLRQLNIPVSSYQVHGFAEAINYIDITIKDDFYNVARSFLLHDIFKRQQFDIAFDLFWSNYLKVILDFQNQPRSPYTNKVAENEAGALSEGKNSALIGSKVNQPSEIDNLIGTEPQLRPTYSPYEFLRYKDFSKYSEDELHQARKIINDMSLDFKQKRTRRRIQAAKKSKFLDFRASIRNNRTAGGELIDLKWQKNKYRSRQLIVLCDISGSMERYTQIFLYFLYAIAQDIRRIETFVFGTRLTRLTLMMRKKKADQVLDNLSSLILDWSGGTKIGESLRDFNYQWARRVRCQGSIVLIISDGWDRGNHELLRKEISRMSRTAYRLIWLNPLAETDDYLPLVQGMQIVLPYLSDFLPLANLNNLESLSSSLGSI